MESGRVGIYLCNRIKTKVMETKKIDTEQIMATESCATTATHAIDIEREPALEKEKERHSNPVVVASVISAAAGVAAGMGIGATVGAVVDGLSDSQNPAADTSDTADMHESIAGLADPSFVAPELIAVPEPLPVTDPVATVEPTPVAEPSVEPVVVSPTDVNPADVADELVAGEMIDPADANASDMLFEVVDINNVYTVDGESMLSVSIHDIDGNDLVMVDVDGDDILDVVTDVDGNILSAINGGVSESDLELSLSEEVGYLAQDESDMGNVYGDSFENDIIDPTTLV